MKKILIVGYGNTLRGDDGIGPLIAQQIADSPQPTQAEVQVACLPQLDISIVSDMRDADTVIFVDARHDEETDPVTVKRVEPVPASAYAGHSTHSIGVPALLSIARDWYGKKQNCYLVTPKGYDFSISDKISVEGHRAAASAIEKISEIIETEALGAGVASCNKICKMGPTIY